MDNIDLTIRQGDTYQHTFNWVDSVGDPIDLTGWTSRMQIRKSATSSVDPLIDLTSEDVADDMLVLTYVTGVNTLDLPPAITAALPVTTTAVYDLEIVETATGYVETIAYGTVTIVREITR